MTLLRRFTVVLLLLGAAAQSTSAAAAIVQSKQAAVNTATATNTVTWDTAATAGNLLVIIAACNDYVTAGNRPSGFTQSTGMAQETFHGMYLWWKVAAGGETSASYTLNSAEFSVWHTLEISGLTASPYDISAGQFQQTLTSSYTTPAITPTSGDRYLIAAQGGSRPADGITLSTWLNSFTERGDVSNTTGTGTRDVAGWADFSVTANGSTSYSSGVTYSQTVDAKTGLIIAFKVAAAGAAPPAKQLLLGVGEAHR